MWAGTGSAGVVVPFLLQWLLDSYGFRTALRVWALVIVSNAQRWSAEYATLTCTQAIGLTPCLLIVKGRLPVTASNALRLNDLQFLKGLSFWLLELGNVSQSFAFFIPAIWIPSFTLAIGLPGYSGPLGLALINLAACFGAVLIGMYVFWPLFSCTRPKNSIRCTSGPLSR